MESRKWEFKLSTILVQVFLIAVSTSVSSVTDLYHSAIHIVEDLGLCRQHDILLVSNNVPRSQNIKNSTISQFEFNDFTNFIKNSNIDKAIAYIDMDSHSETDMPSSNLNPFGISGGDFRESCIIVMTLDVSDSAQFSKLSKYLSLGDETKTQDSTVVFIATESSDPAKIGQLFANLRLRLDSNVYILSIHLKTLRFNLWEIFNIKMRQIIQKVEMASEYRKKKFSKSHIHSPAARRHNFHGERIVATIRPRQLDWMRFEGTGENIKLVGGFSVNMYWNFQTMLNFTDGALIGDGLTTTPNKTLGGKTFEQLSSGASDISLSTSTIVPFRAKQLTFLQPSYYGIINCFFQQPPANSIRNIVTAPFKTSVWISLITTWIFLITVVKISSALQKFAKNRTIIQFSNGEWPHYPLDDGLDKDTAFAKEIGMWAFTANCQKSWHLIPTSVPMKMMFLIGILCGVVSYTGYSGAIVSSLTVKIVPVNEFNDLIRFNFLFTVHEWSEPFQIFLQLMIDNQNLNQKVLKITTAEEISHLMEKQNQQKAFLTYSDLFYPTALQLNYTELFICKHISKVQVSPVLYKFGMFLKKGSELAEMFNLKLMIQKERGFNHRYVMTYETANIFPCGQGGHESVDPISFVDIFTAFLVICGGLIASFFLLVVEFVFFKLTRRQIVD